LLPLMHRDSSSSPSFLSRFTPRYDILNCMSGTENGRPQKKTKTKPKNSKKNGGTFFGVDGDHGGYDPIRRPHSASYTLKIFLGRLGRFNCVFHLETTFFRGLFFHSPFSRPTQQNEMIFIPFYFESYSRRRSWN
jgi:hypothetical protein